MPAQRLDNTPITVRRFDVAAQDSGDIPEFVRHIGLAQRHQQGVTRKNAALTLIHMGPPLSKHALALEIDATATAALTANETMQIRAFIDELQLEYAAQEARGFRQYVIHPHATEPDRQFPFRRFNCAGFVVEAYRDAGIELVQLDDGSLPRVSLETLKRAYPDQAKSLERKKLRATLGLDGDGPWPVLLAGYVINAMARLAPLIRNVPFVPSIGDEFFPPRS